MKRADVDLFEKLFAQLDGFYQELSLLAKKSPKDAVNVFKLSFINGVLRQCNDLLEKKYKPFPDFEIFSVDDLPSNSDVTFIIAQYIECAEKLRTDNVKRDQFNRYSWVLEDSNEMISTGIPKKLFKKD